MHTQNLELVLHAPQHFLALIEGPECYEQSFGIPAAAGFREMFVSGEVSPAWLAQLQVATAADPWTFGFAIVHSAGRIVIGAASFKGPPGADGVVEIAYGIVPAYRGQGFATEAAQALIGFAFAIASGQVRVIRAHTLPEPNASTKVLAKCGFNRVAEIVDPEDGLVWRWDKHPEAV